MFERLGLEEGRVIYEDRSRNTTENAEFSRDIARPRPEETWLLITSAFHMPRAVGCFRRVGWNVVPFGGLYDRWGLPDGPAGGL